MATDKILKITKFFGGITRDEKSKIAGVASNLEEVDIFTNGDYIQAEQIFSSDALPATTEAYAYTADNNTDGFAYGKETAASKVRILKLTAASQTNPGAWATFFTSADTTNLAYSVSPIQFFKTSEGSPYYLYYCTLASTTVVLKRLDITTVTESTVGTLTGLGGLYDKISFKVLFGELFITNGKYIAKVDADGTFTNAGFTLPNEWTAVDLVPVSDVSLILARHTDRTSNFCKGFWWDLTSSTQFDDSFDVPAGGPQWIINHKETVKFCCAINGKARFFQLSGAFAGAIPLEIPGMVLDNVQIDGSTQPVSPPKSVVVKDKILYFGLWKTDKSGLYAIGQLDSDKPTALLLSKRFTTSDYSLHKPTGAMVAGPNFFVAYVDNGTAATASCETNNTPNRSSSAKYESVWIDDGEPMLDKDLSTVYVAVQPLPASTDVNVYVASDYGSYSEITRGDATSLNTTSAVMGQFLSKSSKAKKVVKIKVELVSSGANSPKLTAVGLRITSQSAPSGK